MKRKQHPAPADPASEPAEPRDGTRASRDAALEPRLPHERDESADAQADRASDPQGRRALRDIESGRVDTDRGPLLDRVYRRQRER